VESPVQPQASEQGVSRAKAAMTAETSMAIVPGATHLFEEPGKLERVVELARDWFEEHLVA
jgi:putative phosphoribosyl transferase